MGLTGRLDTSAARDAGRTARMAANATVKIYKTREGGEGRVQGLFVWNETKGCSYLSIRAKNMQKKKPEEAALSPPLVTNT